MKKKIFMLLTMVMTAMTASAVDVPTYSLTAVESGGTGTITFKVGESTVTSAAEGAEVTMIVTPPVGLSVGPVTGEWYAAEAATRSNIGILKDITLTKVEGQENTWTFTMERANAEISITYAKIIQASWIQDISAVTYNGSAQTPTVTVKDGETTLTLNTDYTVSYSNNKNAGTATATVKGTGNYSGEASKTFTINKATLTAATLKKTNLTYNMQEQTAEVASVKAGQLNVPAEGYDVKNNKATAVGNYTATITGKGNFSGSVNVKFSIVTADASLLDVALSTDEFVYDGKAKMPTVTVKYGGTVLTEDTDYKISTSNNVNAGTVYLTVAGIGSYSGTTTVTFTIKKASGSVVFKPWQFTKNFGAPNFTIRPSVTGDGTLTYSSEDPTVAEVDENSGVVTIIGTGTARIWANLSEGDNYTGDSDWYELTVEPADIEYESGDITQDENGYTINLTEDTDNPSADPLPIDIDLADLTYSRTLTAPGSSEGDATIDNKPANLFTVCLPFDPETDESAKYYTLSSVSGETLNFSEVDTPVANTPYLVAVFGSINLMESCDDLEISSLSINSTTVDGYTFNGTFTGMTNAQAAGKYILQAANKWGRVTKEKPNAYIPPFRAYVEGPANGARLLAGSIEDGTTGIQYIRTTDTDGTEQWYDMNGRHIDKPTRKGVFIHGGRKEVVR